ncbi:suppressor of tumorigenicity 14 protein homolog [Branchiostoma lanceolatum]|uniref:suppressor of tumorigenicity 14 protein homolog n=1 Tax=Branchiostoma lanceolatum TaxID=7740 RepID=UPI003452EB5B
MNSQRRVQPLDAGPENEMFDNPAFDGHPSNTPGHQSFSQTAQTSRVEIRRPNETDIQRYTQPKDSTENHIHKPELCSSQFAISVTVVVIIGLAIIVGLTVGVVLQAMSSSSPSKTTTVSPSQNTNDKTTTTASPYAQTQAPTAPPTCAQQGLWGCDDGNCINPAWLCDGDHDCTGGEDENNCPTSCSSFQFECADGTCISASWQCDTESDCSNGDDEVNCTAKTCTSTEFTCDNGACIALSLTCDSYRDCSGGEDELNCQGLNSTAVPIVLQGNCSADQRFCYDSAKNCIEAAQWCDGTDHCPTGRDEKFCTCGRRPAVETSRRGSTRIVGGTEPTRGAWPWQVSLHDGGSHSCGASLVNTKFLVTAAHCVYDSQIPGSWTAYLGLHEQGENTEQLQTRDVDRIIIHERYDAIRTDFDIALMELSSEINITDHVYPVCLPSDDTEFAVGTNCWISGWGSVADGGVQATTLQEAEVPLVDTTVCDDAVHYDGQITDRMLCAGYDAGGIDACQGDSGGPLVCQDGVTWYLVGVTSWGDGCGQPNKPGIYADVKYLRDWINTKLES